MPSENSEARGGPGLDFVRAIVDADVKSGRNGGKVVTRFPPEPNGYLHIGHAKAICLDFGIAGEFGGRCHLRMDDTNPSKEDEEYVNAIQEDIRWLGFEWGGNLFYASDYFPRLYEFAVALIRAGKAYVCDLSQEEFKEYRGAPNKPGRESPCRNRPAGESLDLFRRMKDGEFEEGRYVLRAKIDMNSPNIHMRDPAIYRIKKAPHHRTGAAWVIYPMYDFAHCLSDAIEGITHSICTLEFEVHRPLYDWIIGQLDVPCHPRQIEFARLNLSYTIMSKRMLQQLVNEKLVSGWDDPRMPTLAGMRRRGYTPGAIRSFSRIIGVTKFESLTDVALLEHCIRSDLNKTSPRVMGVIRPLKAVIENYPAGRTENFEAAVNPEDPSAGNRSVPFSREIYIDRDDFMENPPKSFFRLAPAREVRLRSACLLTCRDVVRNGRGEVVELRCVYDPDSRGGHAPDGRKVKGTIHWVSAAHALEAEFRLYDRLFNAENPAAAEDFKACLNPASLQVARGFVEPSVRGAAPGSRFQMERTGYFCVDPDSTAELPVFNRTVTLKDTWEKVRKPAPSAPG